MKQNYKHLAELEYLVEIENPTKEAKQRIKQLRTIVGCDEDKIGEKERQRRYNFNLENLRDYKNKHGYSFKELKQSIGKGINNWMHEKHRSLPAKKEVTIDIYNRTGVKLISREGGEPWQVRGEY